MRSVFGWDYPPGVSSVPGDEPQPPSCEDCPEEQYEHCPGQDKCIEVIFDGHPACCVKHHTEMFDGECGSCVADDFREMERDALMIGYGDQDLTKASVRAHWLRAGISMKEIHEAYIAKRGFKVVNIKTYEPSCLVGVVHELGVILELS